MNNELLLLLEGKLSLSLSSGSGSGLPDGDYLY